MRENRPYGSEKRAAAICGRIEETLQLLQLGRLAIPEDADPGEFIFTDGRRNGKPILPKSHTVGDLLRFYENRPQNEAKEENTDYGEGVHIRHLRKHLKTSQVAQALTTSDFPS